MEIWRTPVHKLWWTTSKDNILYCWEVEKTKVRQTDELICEKCSKIYEKAHEAENALQENKLKIEKSHN